MSDTKGAIQPPPSRRAKPKATPARAAGSIQIGSGKTAGAAKASGRIFAAQGAGSGRQQRHVLYVRSKGVDDFVANIHAADPIRLIETERRGVAGVFVKDLSRRMEMPAQRMFDILGVPKATAEKKAAAGELIAGSGGRAALGLARLLGIAGEMVEDSTAPEAKGFDPAKWLGQWLERPQAALGGRRPAELIDTPTGLAMVVRLLGAIQSSAYQ